MTQQINLIDETLKQGRDWANGVVVISTLTLAALAAGGHWGYEQWLLKRASEDVAAAEAAKEASGQVMQQVSAQVAELQAQLDADEQIRKAAAAMIDPPREVVARFDQLVGGLSPSMWLQSVEFAGARGVHLMVSGLRQADLARYADALSASRAFEGLPVAILSVERKLMQEPASQADDSVVRKSVPYYVFELSGQDNVLPEEAQP